MPDSAPARLDLDRALDEGLQALFRGLQSEPGSEVLIKLIDRLEAAYADARVGGETRSLG